VFDQLSGGGRGVCLGGCSEEMDEVMIGDGLGKTVESNGFEAGNAFGDSPGAVVGIFGIVAIKAVIVGRVGFEIAVWRSAAIEGDGREFAVGDGCDFGLVEKQRPMAAIGSSGGEIMEVVESFDFRITSTAKPFNLNGVVEVHTDSRIFLGVQDDLPRSPKGDSKFLRDLHGAFLLGKRLE